MPVAVGASEFSLVLILLLVVAAPLAAIAFVKSGKGLDNLGKGTFSIDREEPRQAGVSPPETPSGERNEEIRQMVEASNYRRRERGEEELDVQGEIDRLLGVVPGDKTGAVPEEAGNSSPAGDDGIRDEIRQLVIANNERRQRRGEDSLDVESEVDRRLREWT